MRLPRLNWLKRRRNAVLAAIVVLFLAAIVTVFHPRLQTRVLQDLMTKRVDAFVIERVHVLPWSVSIRGLSVVNAGVALELADAHARLAPWKLVLGVAAIRRLVVEDLLVDLRDLKPAETEPEPFQGLFALLGKAPGIELGATNVTGRVLIDRDLSLRFHVSGGGLVPAGEGALDVDTVIRRATDKSRIEIAGTLSFAQGDTGAFTAADADLLARIVSPQLPAEELIEILVHAEPLEEPEIDPENGETIGTAITGDRFRLTVSKPGSGADLLWLSANGTHDARSRTVSGDYELQTNDGLVVFYAPDARLPKFAERSRGSFDIALDTGAAELDFRGDMEISGLDRLLGSNDALPEKLQFLTAFSAAVEAGTLELRSLDARLGNDGAAPLVALELNEPLGISLEAPATLFDRELTLATLALSGIPVNWLNGLLPEPVLRDGRVGGAFDLRTGDATVALVPTAEFAMAGGALDDAFTLPGTLDLRGMPSLSYRGDTIALGLKKLVLMLGESEIAGLDLEASLKLGGKEPATPEVHARGRLDLNGVAALPLVAERLSGRALPDGMQAEFDATLSANAERVRIRALEASVRQNDAPPIVRASALQPFTIGFGTGAPEFRNPEGELAQLEIEDLDLAWLDPFIDQASVAGSLERGAFSLSAGPDGRLSVRTREPLGVRNVVVYIGSDLLIEDLSLSLRPEIDYTPVRTDVRYLGLDVRIGADKLASGSGAVSLPIGAGEQARVSANGELEINLGELARIPPLAQALSRLPAKRQWQLGLDYDLVGDAARIEMSTLRATIAIDGETRMRFENDAALVVRPEIDADEDLAQHLTGVITADVAGVSSEVLGDLLALGGLSFAELSAQATLRSDGEVLTADTTRPFSLSGVRIGEGDAAVLNAFSVSAAAGVRVAGQTIDGTLETLNLVFDAYRDQPAVGGRLSFAYEPSRPIPLRRMEAKLTGFLPALLAQPVLMPGHRLRAAGFTLDAAVREDGAIESVALLDGLKASAPLAIGHMRAEASGALAADGRGFSFSMPLTGHGRTGETDGVLVASYDPTGSDKSLLNLEFTSDRFLLNDVLATLADIRGAPAASPKPATKPATKEAGAKPASAPADVAPDESAFWDLLPYDTRVGYRIRDLYYTDYVILNDVAGEIKLTSSRFTLESLSARFHESPMKFDGALDFIKDSAKPYQLELEGTVSEFDLNQFFSELVPGEKPRVEGLFSVAVRGNGSSPNMAQFRNELLFDVKLKSREGLFRPLPPDSTLMAGASDVLGFVGEGLSYVPTGGFGAGVVSRLVNYIAVIDYDRIDIHVVRDETRDIVIRQFLVQSPTISLTAQGGIDYADGKDILDSPLNLDAHLNMSGKGAAILYSMNLLEDEQDAFGYYVGPAFRIRGTPAAAESNFAEIVTAAADGTVKGAITRPISGLIGNIRHRWFGEEPDRYQEGSGDTTPAPPAASPPQPAPQAP